jgi:hypothetical protein
MLDFEAGSQNSLPSIIRKEIPMLSLRLCLINTEIRKNLRKVQRLQAEKEDR